MVIDCDMHHGGEDLVGDAAFMKEQVATRGKLK